MLAKKTYAFIIGLSVAALVAAVLAIAHQRTVQHANPVAVQPPLQSKVAVPQASSYVGVDRRSIPEAAKRPKPDRYIGGKPRRYIGDIFPQLVSTAKPAIFTIAAPAIEPPAGEAPNQTAIERMKPLDLPPTAPSGAYRSFTSHPELPPGVAYASDTDPVLIEWVQIAPNPVRLGDIVSGRVITSSNAAAVTAQIGTFLMSVPKVAPGTFSVSARVPRALWWPRQVDVVVTATRRDGKSVAATVPVNVTR